MSEKSISFNEEMLRAVLDGRKTQTRRPHAEPRYQVGDIVYVKEPWQITGCTEYGDMFIRYISDKTDKTVNIPEEYDMDGDVFNDYWIETCDDLAEAGVPFNEETETYEEIPQHPYPTRIRSVKKMPEYFSRLSIKITGARKEKLQAITREDAIAEGIEKDSVTNSYRVYPAYGMWTNAIQSFITLWNTCYGDESKQWDANPWVWVYEFERV